MKTIVLSQHLIHFGISTKQKKDPRLSSISWIIEREFWNDIVKKHLFNVIPKRSYKQKIGDKLLDIINSQHKLLIYGCGTVSDFIINNSKIIDFDICSGLEEEIGGKFNNQLVLNVNDINIKKYKYIIITPIGYEKKIKNKYFKNINNIVFLKKMINDNMVTIDIK